MDKKFAEIRVVRVREMDCNAPRLSSPESLARYWRKHVATRDWFDREKECLVVVCLNIRHTVVSHALVSLGSLNETIAHPREIFRPAIATGAYAIVLMHHHPSGDPRPSAVDCELTARTFAAGQLLQVELLDHIIIGAARFRARGRGLGLGFFSFQRADAMDGSLRQARPRRRASTETKSGKVRVRVPLPAAEKRALVAAASRSGISVSKFVEQALREEVARKDGKLIRLPVNGKR